MRRLPRSPSPAADRGARRRGTERRDRARRTTVRPMARGSVIAQLAGADTTVRAIRLSRNFGQQRRSPRGSRMQGPARAGDGLRPAGSAGIDPAALREGARRPRHRARAQQAQAALGIPAAHSRALLPLSSASSSTAALTASSAPSASFRARSSTPSSASKTATVITFRPPVARLRHRGYRVRHADRHSGGVLLLARAAAPRV